MSKSWITKGIQAELDKLVPSLQAQIKKIAKDALDPKVGVAGGKASTVKQVRSEVNKQLKDPKFITKNKRLSKTGEVFKGTEFKPRVSKSKEVKKTTLGKSKSIKERAEKRADETIAKWTTTGLLGSLLLGLGSYLGYTGVKQGAENKKRIAEELRNIQSDTLKPKKEPKKEPKSETPTTPRKVDKPKEPKKVVKPEQPKPDLKPLRPPTGEGSLASDVKKAMEKGKKDPEAVEFRKNYKQTKPKPNKTKNRVKSEDVKKAKPASKPKKDLKPLEQGIREYDTPFGKLVVDSTNEGMDTDRANFKRGGMVFGKGGMYKAPKKVYGVRNGGFTRRFKR